MADNTPTRPTTPTTTTGCKCTGRCKCCDAPVRNPRFAHINNENGRGTKLFSDEKKPGTFPDISAASE